MIPLRYNVRSLVRRSTTTIAAALGMALVVFVLAAALMLSSGIKKTLTMSGRENVAIVLRKGSDAELSSAVEKEHIALLTARDEVARDGSGSPIAVSEVVVVMTQEKIGGDGGISNVQLRGVNENVYAFRPTAHIVEGRPARSGTDEVVIGQRVRGRFRGINLGQSFELKKNLPVQVVGIFEDGGSSFESEIWSDLETARRAFGRETGVSSVRVQLTPTDKFESFKLGVESDKQLQLQAFQEQAYYEKLSEGTAAFVSGLGITIAVFFSIGAMIGALITMYASVAQRRKEIGTLRALGFSRSNVLLSFLAESCMLALAGGVLGVTAAMALGFVRFSMMNFASWSEVTFAFNPTPGILGFAVVFGGIMGIAGGFFPAVRAARIPPIAAMRGA
ncbi:MAG: ABC transporter permease [Clostridia bacterium]|nr:ABC transporter permease [Deltaproteobacteria bacterium]